MVPMVEKAVSDVIASKLDTLETNVVDKVAVESKAAVERYVLYVIK